MPRPKNKEELITEAKQEKLFTNTYYPWVGGSCIGSYFICCTSSHYDWAMKKMKAHRKNVEEICIL